MVFRYSWQEGVYAACRMVRKLPTTPSDSRARDLDMSFKCYISLHIDDLSASVLLVKAAMIGGSASV